MGGLLRGSVAEVAVVGHGYPPRLVSAGVEGVVVCLWGSVLVGRLLDGSEGVRGSCWVVLECWASGEWSMRANLGEGLEEFLGLRGTLSLSLDGRGLGVFGCGVG